MGKIEYGDEVGVLNKKNIFLMVLAIVSLLIASTAMCLATKYKISYKDYHSSTNKTIAATKYNSAIVGPYKVTIPDQYLYTTDQDSGIIITDASGQSWMMKMKYVNDFSFAKIYSDTSILSRKYFNYQNLKIEKSTAHDKNVIILDGEKEGTKITHMFFKTDDTNTFIFDVINLSNVYDHEHLEDAYSIVQSAKMQNFPESFQIDRKLFDLSNS